MRIGQKRARGRCRRAGSDQDRSCFGDCAKAAGDAEAILAPRRTRLDGELRGAPVEIREFRPAHARVQPFAAGARERVQIARDSSRRVGQRSDRFDGARHVRCADDEARTEIGWHVRTRSVSMRRDVRIGIRLRLRLRVDTILRQRFAHPRENRIACRAIVIQRFAHFVVRQCSGG